MEQVLVAVSTQEHSRWYGMPATAQCSHSPTTPAAAPSDGSTSFADDFIVKLSALSRELVAEYEDVQAESWEAERSRLRQAFAEKELELKAEISGLKERLAKLSRKLRDSSGQSRGSMGAALAPPSGALSPSPPWCASASSLRSSHDFVASPQTHVQAFCVDPGSEESSSISDDVDSVAPPLKSQLEQNADGKCGVRSTGRAIAPMQSRVLSLSGIVPAQDESDGETEDRVQSWPAPKRTNVRTKRLANRFPTVAATPSFSASGDPADSVTGGGRSVSSRRTKPRVTYVAGIAHESRDDSASEPVRNTSTRLWPGVAGLLGWRQLESRMLDEVSMDELPSRFMLHPNSMVSTLKDIVSVVFLVWDALYLPILLAWDPDPSIYTTAVSIIETVFWTVEMILCMNTGFYTNARLEMRRAKALRQYAKHWLAIDVAIVASDWANMYMDLVFSLNDGSSGLVLIRLVKFNRLMRMARALRVMKVHERLKNVGHSMTAYFLSGSFAFLYRIGQYVVYIFLLNHIVACSWFAIGKYLAKSSDTGQGWLQGHYLELPDGSSIDYAEVNGAYQYVTSLHYAVSSTVLGSLSINPTNSYERVFTVCCLVVGFVIASMLVSSLSSWLVQRQMLRQEKVATMLTLRQFLRENVVSTGLASRVYQHVQTRINIKPKLREEQVDALELLTTALRGELRYDMWSRHLLMVPLIRTWHFLDAKLVEDICLNAVTVRYLEVEDELFNPSVQADNAFVLVTGALSYSSFSPGSGERVVTSSMLDGLHTSSFHDSIDAYSDLAGAVIAPVTWIAEARLWMTWKFVGTAIATTECELLAVDPAGVERVVSKRPALLQIMEHYGETLSLKLYGCESAELSDVRSCVPHEAVVIGIRSQSRVLLAVPALRVMKQRFAFRPRLREAMDRLGTEVAQGVCALAIDGSGNIERVSRRVALRVRRADGRVLMQLGRAKTHFRDREPKLPMRTLLNEEPEEGLSRLLTGDLAGLASALTFGQCSTLVTRAPSRAFSHLSLQNVFVNVVYSATVGNEVTLPGKQHVDIAIGFLKRIEVYDSTDVGALQEVHLLQIGEDKVCCAWLLPHCTQEDFVMRGSPPRTSRSEAAVVRSDGAALHRQKSIVSLPRPSGVMVRRLPSLPNPLEEEPLLERTEETGVPLLRSLLGSRKTDWHLARRAATRICEPEYRLRDFFDDCTNAFPELGLYVFTSSQCDAMATTGGRTTDDEYQRTMGAFFSFFWLMRLGFEGSDAFSFGVDEEWAPMRPPKDPAYHTDEIKRRIAFRQAADWEAMRKMLEDAGILKHMAVASESQNDAERTLAMLALTAIHDIMKVQALLPTVQVAHGPFCGFQPGEVVDDHDIALGYVLEFYPELLPSFAGLPSSAQRSVRFTQCKMEYNMGWLVQAEAPPGALLTTLRRIVSSGKASQNDIAFYFVHWFTDLAGAVPTPLAGSEKFVLGFPLKVLCSFVSSFSIVGKLADFQSETQVCENYLRWRWEAQRPPLGPPPEGYGAIAKMRLIIMAQGNSKLILDAFKRLPEGDRRILSEELARTGCEGQRYATDTLLDTRGPAFLVYYGPAFLQKAGMLDPSGAMQVLAELLRVARTVWPLKSSLGGVTVTVRIDALKAEPVQALLRAPSDEAWVLEKVSDRSCSVSLAKWPPLGGEDWRTRCVLNFGNATPAPKTTAVPGRTDTLASSDAGDPWSALPNCAPETSLQSVGSPGGDGGGVGAMTHSTSTGSSIFT